MVVASNQYTIVTCLILIVLVVSQLKQYHKVNRLTKLRCSSIRRLLSLDA